MRFIHHDDFPVTENDDDDENDNDNDDNDGVDEKSSIVTRGKGDVTIRTSEMACDENVDENSHDKDDDDYDDNDDDDDEDDDSDDDDDDDRTTTMSPSSMEPT